MENLHFTAQITRFPEKFSNPQRGKSKDFSAGKCYLLYFVVVSESLTSFSTRKSSFESPFLRGGGFGKGNRLGQKLA